jgi:hypothetical protein
MQGVGDGVTSSGSSEFGRDSPAEDSKRMSIPLRNNES